jgi:hypothetical protein
MMCEDILDASRQQSLAHRKPSLLRGINLGNWLVPEGYMWHLNNGGPGIM